MLRVVVAEVQRELLKQFGINLAADINAPAILPGVCSPPTLSAADFAAAGLRTLPGSPGVSAFIGESRREFSRRHNLLLWHRFHGRNTLRKLRHDNRLELERRHDPQGNARTRGRGPCATLAEPNLTAISGEAGVLSPVASSLSRSWMPTDRRA